MNERLDALVKEVTAEPDLEVSSSTVLTSITGFIRENANSPRALVDFARDLEAYRAPLALAIGNDPHGVAKSAASLIGPEISPPASPRAPLDRIVATSPEMEAGRAAALADQGKTAPAPVFKPLV